MELVNIGSSDSICYIAQLSQALEGGPLMRPWLSRWKKQGGIRANIFDLLSGPRLWSYFFGSFLPRLSGDSVYNILSFVYNV